jgi:hypothetical protein
MTERPILFSGPMVRAILEGRKTQTRRVIKRLNGRGEISEFGPSTTRGYEWHFRDKRGLWNDVDTQYILDRCPYGKFGDRLWVRETIARSGGYIQYVADGVVSKLPWPSHWKNDPRPSIHMPRHVSRIALEITGVRIERVQDITGNDVLSEGTEFPDAVDYTEAPGRWDAFRRLWDSINAARGFGWDVNPPVWVIEFKRVKL